MIKLNNISKEYSKGTNQIGVLKSLSCQIHSGEMIALMGRSGSGKTTLMNIMSGLLSPSSGEYLYKGTDIFKLKVSERDAFREKNIGIIVQDYGLINSMTAYENIMLPLNYRKKISENDKIRLDELSKELGIEDCLNKKIHALSGGESQRVAIARALIKNPTLLLADEPTGALDSGSEINIMKILQKIKTECTILIATHSPVVSSYCDRSLYISDGTILTDSF